MCVRKVGEEGRRTVWANVHVLKLGRCQKQMREENVICGGLLREIGGNLVSLARSNVPEKKIGVRPSGRLD